MCAGSMWDRPNAIELATTPDPWAPSALEPAIEQTAEHELLGERRQSRDQEQARRQLPGGADHLDQLLDPIGLLSERAYGERDDQGAQHTGRHKAPAGRPEGEQSEQSEGGAPVRGTMTRASTTSAAPKYSYNAPSSLAGGAR